MRLRGDDLRHVPRFGIVAYAYAYAYAKAKAATEVFAFEVDLSAQPVYPVGAGKDTAAWSAVRALTDPSVCGGEYFAPSGRHRGALVSMPSSTKTAAPASGAADRLWRQVEELMGATIHVASIDPPIV